ncbi:MAG: hypothetical protein ABIA04_00535 [Pseudomonadota bacterium]
MKNLIIFAIAVLLTSCFAHKYQPKPIEYSENTEGYYQAESYKLEFVTNGKILDYVVYIEKDNEVDLIINLDSYVGGAVNISKEIKVNKDDVAKGDPCKGSLEFEVMPEKILFR